MMIMILVTSKSVTNAGHVTVRVGVFESENDRHDTFFYRTSHTDIQTDRHSQRHTERDTESERQGERGNDVVK